MFSGLVLLALSALAVSSYTPPIGIPAPAFGITQSHEMYSGREFQAGKFSYNNAGNGAYSHYVDNSKTCADGGNNPFGTAARPRCSIPANLPAGSVVEVHGGPYTGATVTAAGTASAPVFIRGTGPDRKPRFTSDIFLTGSFVVLEYVEVVARVVSRPPADAQVLRYSHVHSDNGPGALVVIRGSNSVVFQNELSDAKGRDVHGITLAGEISNVWILDNHIHGNSGDSIQFCHACIRTGQAPSQVYIGRNRLHDDGENALDVKAFHGAIVVSENEMYGYRDTATGNGEAIRVNDEGTQGEIWIIANRIHDSLGGVNAFRSHAARNGRVFVVGNEFWNLEEYAIGPGATAAVNNTIYNAPIGIGAAREIRNNIFMNSDTPVRQAEGNCSHNIAFKSGSLARGCSNGLKSDPKFKNPANGDFSLISGSPALGAGVQAATFELFENKHGIRLRSKNSALDAGAASFTGRTAGQTAAAPR
jgi:hypothetical protein